MSYLTDYSDFLQSQHIGKSFQPEKIKRDLIARFNSSPSYAKVTATNADYSTEEVEIQTTATKDSKEQLILTHPNQPLTSGMVLNQLRKSDWLVIDVKEVGEINQEAKIMRMNVEIKWMNGTVVEQAKISAYSRGGDAKFEKFFSTPNGSAIAFLPNNVKNVTIGLNKRFMINGFPYQVIKIDNFSYDNVLVLTLTESALRAEDVNGVCDFVTVITPPVGTFDLIGKDQIRMGTSAFYEVFDPNNLIPNITWNFSIDVSSFLTVVSTPDRITLTPLPGSIGKVFTLVARKNLSVTEKEIRITSLV